MYKGAALGTVNGNNFLYATNFQAGTVEVFNSNFALTSLGGTFRDPNVSGNFAPFNIKNINNEMFVTFAMQDASKTDDVPGLGNGFISVFDTSGNFLRRFATGDNLNSPWGMTIAPASFREFGGDLLVGNFGDGRIHAFNLQSGQEVGTLVDSNGKPISIDGLWTLTIGNGGTAGSTNQVFFTAGINDEVDGLFGTIQPVPEPLSMTILLAGAGLLMKRAKRGA